MPHREIVEKICIGSDCHASKRYCILQEIINHFGPPNGDSNPGSCDCRIGEGNCVLKDRVVETGIPDRTLMQIKLLEIFKWDRHIPDWNSAFMAWVREGYALKFGVNYSPDIEPRKLYGIVTTAA